MTKSIKVFISYNHEDKATADRMKSKLKDTYPIIIDSDSIEAGENIENFIKRSIQDSDITLSLVSERSLLSAWVAMETIISFYDEKIKGEGERFIPVAITNKFFERDFTDSASKEIEREMDEISKLQYERTQKKKGTRELNSEYELYRQLNNEIDGIIERLRRFKTVDIAGDHFDKGMEQVVERLEGKNEKNKTENRHKLINTATDQEHSNKDKKEAYIEKKEKDQQKSVDGHKENKEESLNPSKSNSQPPASIDMTKVKIDKDTLLKKLNENMISHPKISINEELTKVLKIEENPSSDKCKEVLCNCGNVIKKIEGEFLDKTDHYKSNLKIFLGNLLFSMLDEDQRENIKIATENNTPVILNFPEYSDDYRELFFLPWELMRRPNKKPLLVSQETQLFRRNSESNIGNKRNCTELKVLLIDNSGTDLYSRFFENLHLSYEDKDEYHIINDFLHLRYLSIKPESEIHDSLINLGEDNFPDIIHFFCEISKVNSTRIKINKKLSFDIKNHYEQSWDWLLERNLKNQIIIVQCHKPQDLGGLKNYEETALFFYKNKIPATCFVPFCEGIKGDKYLSLLYNTNPMLNEETNTWEFPIAEVTQKSIWEFPIAKVTQVLIKEFELRDNEFLPFLYTNTKYPTILNIKPQTDSRNQHPFKHQPNQGNIKYTTETKQDNKRNAGNKYEELEQSTRSININEIIYVKERIKGNLENITAYYELKQDRTLVVQDMKNLKKYRESIRSDITKHYKSLGLKYLKDTRNNISVFDPDYPSDDLKDIEQYIRTLEKESSKNAKNQE